MFRHGNTLLTIEGAHMAEMIRTIAVLAANPALSSILTMVLAADSRLRVREFTSLRPLSTYMSLTPVDVVVCDFDSETARADMVAAELRSNESLVQCNFQIIALARTLSIETRPASIRAGIDEVIVKPMSPRYLHERILSRLRNPGVPTIASPCYSGTERRNRFQPRDPAFQPPGPRGDNVISLFPNR
jgi:DNA-binding response OmpR family regulator